MSAALTPNDYPYRQVYFGPEQNAQTRTLLLEHGTDPDALMLDLLRDAIAAKMHLFIAARDKASLALVGAAFQRLVQQSPVID